MALKDMGHIEFEEPFKKFRAHGLIIRDGAKMSKSRGNVVNPDVFIATYGSDCFRTYLMFLGPYTQGGDFQDAGIMGIKRFYDRIHRLATTSGITYGSPDDRAFTALMHKTIRDVTVNISNLEYNTAIAFIMEYLNGLTKLEKVWREPVEVLVRLIAPFAPHIAEELWESLGHGASVFNAGWPVCDETKIVADTFDLVVQVNGKVRATISAPAGISKEDAITLAASSENAKRFTEGMTVLKTVYVPGKLVNIVVKQDT